MKRFSFYQLMGDMEISEQVYVPPGPVMKHYAKKGAKYAGLGALGTVGLAGGALYGGYRAVKGLAKGAVNAIRYPFRPYERERDEEVEESEKQKFVETTQLDEYLQKLDEKINAKNILPKGYDWTKNKWRSSFRKPTKNLGGPGVKAWKQHTE